MTEPATIPPSELLANLRQNTSDGVLRLASHAALPVVVDAGFVNLLRVNFFLDPPDELPFEAEADLLLSPLCREIGDELYELDPAVRNLLLIMLQSRYGTERVRQVALLLEQYTQSTPTWTAQPELEQAQQLTALSYVDQARAQAWLDDARTGAKAERLSPDWYIAMRARLAARPPESAAVDELDRALAGLEDDNARIRLGAVNTLAVLSQLPDADVFTITEALTRMLRTRASTRVERIDRDIQAAVTLVGTIPRPGLEMLDLREVWLTWADLRNLDLSLSTLANATLIDCRADGLSLSYANLSSARLMRVSLQGADLAETNLDDAFLLQVDFTDANLTDAVLPAPLDHLVEGGIIFTRANLTGTQFQDHSFESPETSPAPEERTSPVPEASPDRVRELQADTLYDFAEEFEQSGNLDEAVKSAEDALQRYATLADSYAPDSGSATSYRSKRIITLLMLSKLHARQGNLQPAIERATEAVVRLRGYAVDDQASLAAALVNLTELHIAVGDTDSARRDIEEAVELYRELAADTGQFYTADLARSLSVLASLFTDDQSATLARTFDEAIALYREAGPEFSSGLALTLLNQARWFLRLARLPEALAAANQALGLVVLAQDDASLASAYQTLGDIKALQANYDEAQSDYALAVEYARAASNRQGEAIARYRRGDALRHLDQADEAIASLMAAAELFRQLNDVPWEAISLRTSGQLLDKAGRPDAVPVLRMALDRFQSLNDAPMSALTMSDLGHALLEAGEPTTAVGILQDALGIIRRQDYPQAEATTLQRLGVALRSVGRLEEAAEALQEAMNIFYGIDDKESAEQALQLVHQIRADAPAETSRPTSRPPRTSTQLVFYLVCDTSVALEAEPIRALNSSLTDLLATVQGSPNSNEIQMSIIAYSSHAYTILETSDLQTTPSIPSIAAHGAPSYGAVIGHLRRAIQKDAEDLNRDWRDNYVPIVYFISSCRQADGWSAPVHELTDPARTYPRPVILAFGLGDDRDELISRIATFSAFIAEPDTDPAEAVRTIISRLTTSLINSADGAPDLPTSLPGFRSIAPAGGIAGTE